MFSGATARGAISFHLWFRVKVHLPKPLFLETILVRHSNEFLVDSHMGTQLIRQLPQSLSSMGNLFVQVRFGGVPTTVEEVV